MNCRLCEEESSDIFCESCKEQLKDKIGMKCIKCGTYGFLPPTPKNIERLEFFIPDFKENLTSFENCVIPSNGCPNCLENEIIVGSDETQFTAGGR